MSIGFLTALVAFLYTVEAVEAWHHFGGIKQKLTACAGTVQPNKKLQQALMEARKKFALLAGFASSYWGIAFFKLTQSANYGAIAYAGM